MVLKKIFSHLKKIRTTSIFEILILPRKLPVMSKLFIKCNDGFNNVFTTYLVSLMGILSYLLDSLLFKDEIIFPTSCSVNVWQVNGFFIRLDIVLLVRFCNESLICGVD